MTKEYLGKVALVTGGACGIGFSIARSLAQQGAHVVIADKNADGGTSVENLLSEEGLSAEFIHIDLAVPGQAAEMVEKAAKHTGIVNVLVNNARAGERLGLFEETEENWDMALGVGLKAAFFSSQALIKLCAAQGSKGSIVNIASIAAILATNEAASYHAAKAGLQQITRYLAVVAGPYNVRVNGILPGLIIQERHYAKFNASDNEAYQKLATSYQPLGEVGDEKDVAEAVLYLCSKRAKYVSGISLVIDGGATVQEQFGLLLRQLQDSSH